MKVLVIGNGAREHALVWKVAQSSHITEVFVAPGNPGMAEQATCVSIPVDDIDHLVEFALSHHIGLTIVGPEYPCSLGLVDRFEEAGLRIFGPRQAAAQLETSKGFAKSIMQAAGVETARYVEVRSHKDALQALSQFSHPVVLKADGLAAGKGVVICHDEHEISIGLSYLFGELAAQSIIIEEFVKGVEVSFIVATDGDIVLPLVSSHDYKRIGDGNTGPNTGGMGSISPTPYLQPGSEGTLIETIIKPVLAEMSRRGIHYRGFLYAGLIIPEGGKPSVLEFNVRLGDPEAQVILRRWQSDFVTDIIALLDGTASSQQISWSNDAAACIVKASQGYPASARKGDVITGTDKVGHIPSLTVFHAGTARGHQGELITAGGRVLSITATGCSVEEALGRVYQAAEVIHFPGEQYRRDIGGRNG
jgi:phosphoribosylamine---glycine ligase